PLVGDAEALGRGTAGLVGGVIGGVEHGVGSIVHRGNNGAEALPPSTSVPPTPTSGSTPYRG
ncbi:MAG: hypothetical protein IVW57_14145, partial [Ktedonobacterales bacterium]|nr:hypothetical protein [Ktedonobacterales bacterium]